MPSLEDFVKRNEVLTEAISRITEEKWKLMEIVEFNRYSIRNTKKALNHIKLKMGLMIRELQDIREDLQECVDQNEDVCPEILRKNIDNVLQDLKIMPAMTMHKTAKGKIPNLENFANCEMSIVIWKFDA